MNEDYRSLSDKVFDRLEEDILSGKYKKGETLKEKSLSEEYGVSRTPVREALRQLELEGLVSMIPNRGARVAGFSPEDIHDMYEIRSMLEGMCSGLPVLQRTDPLNADQVLDGQNGYNFNSAEEMVEKLRQIQTMDPDTLAKFKESVIESIRNSGARDLASHTLAVYEKILKK